MSQPAHAQPNLANPLALDPGTGQPPQSGQTQGESRFVDGSGPLFSMYLEMAEEEDKKMTDSWKGDADGILIFTGLFSAAVAALVAVSVQDLKPNSQDISAFYLAKLYQQSADSNGTQVLIPSTLPDPSVPFSPPKSAVWVNSLWFLSLAISLTCALLATLLQQWSRRYLRITKTRYSPHKRARIRAFFAEGVDKLHLPWAVEALPALLHLSLFSFFAGLAVFLFNINHTVFKVAVSWIGVCTGIYACITFMPMFRHDSPYYAPLSSSPWYLYNGTLSAVFGICGWIESRHHSFGYRGFDYKSEIYHRRILRGIEKMVFETAALNVSSEIDGRALVGTFESLDEDQELERFFAGIPGFCSSTVVDDPRSMLMQLNRWLVDQALTGFLERTLSSSLVSEPIKERRFIICVRAIDAIHLPIEGLYIFLEFLAQHTLVRSIELGHSLITRGDNNDRDTAPCAQGIIAYIISNTPQNDQCWFSLTMYQLGIPERVLRVYVAHGDSVLLANLIHITRQLFRGFLKAESPVALSVALCILPQLSNLRVQETLPRLQHDFCQLWNEITRTARGHVRLLPLLQRIRHIYVALHQDAHATPTASSASTSDYHDSLYELSSYPLCSIPSHRLDPVSDFNEADNGETLDTIPLPINTFTTVPRSDIGPSVIPLIANCDGPRSSTSSIDHTKPKLAPDTLQRITPAAPSSYLILPENDRFPDDAVASAVQDTADPSLRSFTANFGPHSTLGGDAASPDIGSTTITARPTFDPEAVPTPTPILVVDRADPAAPLVPVNQSDRVPHDGLVSLPSIQTAASSSFAPRVNSSLDSNTMTNSEIVSYDPPDDILDPNRRVVSQSLIPSSPNIAEDNLRPEDRDPSEGV